MSNGIELFGDSKSNENVEPFKFDINLFIRLFIKVMLLLEYSKFVLLVEVEINDVFALTVLKLVKRFISFKYLF